MGDTSGFAIAAIVMGILSLGLAWIPLFGLIFVVLTLAVCFIAMSKIKKKNLEGKGLAITGIILGFLSLIPALFITLGVIGLAAVMS